MSELPRPDEISLTIAALRMRVNYHKARALMLEGALRGRQIGGRWYVLAADCERVAHGGARAVAQPA